MFYLFEKEYYSWYYPNAVLHGDCGESLDFSCFEGAEPAVRGIVKEPMFIRLLIA